MDISLTSAFKIVGLVASYADRALEDGKVTITETVNLGEEVSIILGIPLEIDMAPPIFREGDSVDIVSDSLKPRKHKSEA